MKKQIVPKSVKYQIIKFLSFLPDSVMIRLQFYIKTGRFPNLKNPQRFTEKLQVYKLKYRNTLMHQCVDKYNVRKYVESKGLGHILNELYGVYDNASEIDFHSLPQQFVIKTTDGGNGDNVFICRDKNKVDWSVTKEELAKWKDKKDLNISREWVYTGMSKSQYIAEEYLCDLSNQSHGLIDYKFFCFNGLVYMIQFDYDRYTNHKMIFLDRNWHLLDIKRTNVNQGYLNDINISEQKEQMIKIAETLSSDFPFVRVDLYSVNNKIYFGELTFYPASGYGAYKPDTYDFTLGQQFDISSFNKLKQ